MSDTWIVQWYSRLGVDWPEHPAGRAEFADEESARACYTSPAAQKAVGPRVRGELLRQPATEVVESTGYREESS